MSEPAKMVRLNVESPDMRDRAEFSAEFPRDISEANYNYLREHLEFRRRCMNQGFDNLLELLEMHWRVFQIEREKQQQSAAGGAGEGE